MLNKSLKDSKPTSKLVFLLSKFKENEEVHEWFKNVGWECLVSFDDVSVYPNILCQFYANIIPVKDNH